ncbi:MAG: AI-2E family transporter [Verrucomicrobiaceae bacterium]|nr:MAG: AI-2E family transporter [Verrucomicrobiaceae bacterium]
MNEFPRSEDDSDFICGAAQEGAHDVVPHARMNAPEFPTPWQRKVLWSALTAAAIVTIGAIAVGLIWLLSRVLGFLQPILIPFAVAGVVAYLLDPVVTRIIRLANSRGPIVSRLFFWGTSRHRAVLAVFAIVTLVFAGILVWIVPAISSQSVHFARKIPRYAERAKEGIVSLADDVRLKYGVNILPQWQKVDGTNGTSLGKLLPGMVATVPTNPPTPILLPEAPFLVDEGIASTTPALHPAPEVTGDPATAASAPTDPTLDIQQFINGA